MQRSRAEGGFTDTLGFSDVFMDDAFSLAVQVEQSSHKMWTEVLAMVFCFGARQQCLFLGKVLGEWVPFCGSVCFGLVSCVCGRVLFGEASGKAVVNSSLVIAGWHPNSIGTDGHPDPCGGSWSRHSGIQQPHTLGTLGHSSTPLSRIHNV